jgi:hypothetical protein
MFVSIILALAFAHWLYSLAHLRGTSAFWQQQSGDITQYIAGFNAFVREPWQWPLLHFSSINWPSGTLATFVDAIPLYAFFLKLFHHGPETGFWNPYGIWVAICYGLQGLGAWWICRESNVKSWSALIALTLLLASFPALSYRANHISLMSQWLLLFSFAIYLRGTRQGYLASRYWIALVFCAFYINIYLFCMVSAIFAADLGRHAANGNWRRALLTLIAAYAMIGLSLFITILPLGEGAGSREWGFGYYSMNLLAPLTGGRLLAWPHPVVHGGQSEGFNYLGIFVIALFAYAIRLRNHCDKTFWSRHRGLFLVLGLLAVYAPSNVVHLGEVRLFEWILPEWTLPLTAQLRASGRFFWPVGYVIIIFTVLTVYRHAGTRRAAALLPVVVLLQLWDLQPHHDRTRAIVHGTYPVLLNEARWDGFLGAAPDTLHFYPSFRCGKNPANESVLPTMLYAAKRNLNLSTGYIARAVKPCDNYAGEIAAIKSPASAFVFVRSEFTDLNEVKQLLGGEAAADCVEVDFAYLCKRAPQGGTEK